MKTARLVFAVLMPVALALPALGETYKYAYPDPCNVMWNAVRDTLSHKDQYNVKKTDDAKMNADFQPKHDVHFDVSGVILQRENHVRLAPKGPGCEMDVVSNYSGWGHDDQGDFKKRVEASLAKIKSGTTTAPEKPSEAAAPSTPSK